MNFVLALPLVSIGLFFLYIEWRRGIRFIYHDYQDNRRERLRDNFLSSFTVITAICCFILIWSPISLQGFVVPLILFLILSVTPLSMLGAYWSSFLTKVMSGITNINNEPFGLRRIDDGPTIIWYELTPLAFVAGCVVYYMVHAGLLFAKGIEITTENAPAWITITGLVLGGLVAYIIAVRIYIKFRSSP